jgi:predicted DNA binding CopG/RHH family protein
VKVVQRFSKEYLEQTANLPSESVIQFLEDFRMLHCEKQNSKSTLISLKVPENLLRAFRHKANLCNVKYQTQIKILMESWIKS